MENASKALLIAASVLIVILLIAFGVKIFDSATGTQDSLEATMSATEIATFNNKFMPYFGSNKTKTQVISLLNLVISSNATNEGKEITTYLNGRTTSPKVIINRLEEKKYTIEIKETSEGTGGIIKKINIKDR